MARMDAGFKLNGHKFMQIFRFAIYTNLYNLCGKYSFPFIFWCKIYLIFIPSNFSTTHEFMLDLSEIPSKSDCTLNINLTTLFLRANKVLLQANLRRITSFTKKTMLFKKMLSRKFLRMEPCDSSTFAQLKALINYDFNSKANN